LELKKVISITFVLIFLFVVGCSTHYHTVGKGPGGNDVSMQRQWYILWGLVPLNDVDTNDMAGEAEDYEIKTQYTILDFIIGIPASIVTINSRTVKVTK
jgi:hypothetical protein